MSRILVWGLPTRFFHWIRSSNMVPGALFIGLTIAWTSVLLSGYDAQAKTLNLFGQTICLGEGEHKRSREHEHRGNKHRGDDEDHDKDHDKDHDEDDD